MGKSVWEDLFSFISTEEEFQLNKCILRRDGKIGVKELVGVYQKTNTPMLTFAL